MSSSTMKATDLRSRSKEELVSLVGELSQQLWQASFDNRAQRLEDTAKVARIRRHRARAKTILREQESKT